LIELEVRLRGGAPWPFTCSSYAPPSPRRRTRPFNHWYDTDHAPKVLQFNSAVSARRYRKLAGSDEYQYMAVYEFASKEAFERFQASDHLKQLVREYDAEFGTTSERERFVYEQIWP
jgi:hypothetical protein